MSRFNSVSNWVVGAVVIVVAIFCVFVCVMALGPSSNSGHKMQLGSLQISDSEGSVDIYVSIDYSTIIRKRLRSMLQGGEEKRAKIKYANSAFAVIGGELLSYYFDAVVQIQPSATQDDELLITLKRR